MKRIKEQKKYEKVGVVGYVVGMHISILAHTLVLRPSFCFGGAQIVRLGSSDLFTSAVVAHPGKISTTQIEAMKVV